MSGDYKYGSPSDYGFPTAFEKDADGVDTGRGDDMMGGLVPPPLKVVDLTAATPDDGYRDPEY